MPNRYGGVGISLPLNQIGSNQISLQAGQVFIVPPGYFNLTPGPYSSVQTLDPVMGIWRPVGAAPGMWMQVDSDGSNYRVANQTSCPVGALLTQAGAGYTSAPTITPSAGNSKWVAIMGAAISTTVSVVTAGSNYVYAPQVLIAPPPSPGIPATGYATISAGAVTSITILNQGAGYLTAPSVTLLNDPRDTVGGGATATTTLSTLQTVTGVICTDHGFPITSGTVPTLSFAGGGGASAAATVIMDWTVTSYAVTNGGTGYTGTVEIVTQGTGIPTTATAYTNPNSQASFLRTRPASITGALSGTVITATGQTLIDGGHIGGITSNISALAIGATALTVATLTLGVGGQNDFLWIQQG